MEQYHRRMQALAQLAKSQSLDALWQRQIPNRETMHMAVRCCGDSRLLSDEDAVRLIELLCKHGLTADERLEGQPAGKHR